VGRIATQWWVFQSRGMKLAIASPTVVMMPIHLSTFGIPMERYENSASLVVVVAAAAMI
jgi:hypothetical protein